MTSHWTEPKQAWCSVDINLGSSRSLRSLQGWDLTTCLCDLLYCCIALLLIKFSWSASKLQLVAISCRRYWAFRSSHWSKSLSIGTVLKITTILIIFINKMYKKRLLMCSKCRNKTVVDLTMSKEQTDWQNWLDT